MMVRLRRLALLGFLALILLSMVAALAASNTVPTSRLDQYAAGINTNSLKPAACAAITLTTIIACPSGGGQCDGTDGNDLILGSAAVDDILANKGDDCILGGGGDDSLKGEQGTDVCIGGPGVDTFHVSCETGNQ